MKIKLLLLFIFLLNVSLLAQVTRQWTVRYSTPGQYLNDIMYDMEYDAYGNVYVLGTTDTNLGFNVAQLITTQKYNSAGILQWSVKYTSIGYPTAMTLDDSGNVFVTGNILTNTTGYDILLVKYNNSGAQQWSSIINGQANSSDISNDVAADNIGNAYITGYIMRTEGNKDHFTAKYNSSGVQQWLNVISNPSSSSDEGIKVKVNGTGEVFSGGIANVPGAGMDITLIKYNSAGTITGSVLYGGSANNDDILSSMTFDNSGNIYVCGRITQNITSTDGVVLKYNSALALQWVGVYFGAQGLLHDEFNKIAVDNSGNAYVCGSSALSGVDRDIITAKYNTAGVFQWAVRKNSPQSLIDEGISIAIDPEQNIFFTGYISTLSNNTEILIYKYSSAGTELWADTYIPNPNFEDKPVSVMADGNGNIYLGGVSNSGEYDKDMLLIKYSQPLAVEPVSNELPTEFSLSQNYPNPFNPVTNIKFSIPESGNVKLTVFDITGKIAAELLDESINAGEYKIDFDASALSSGVYFYRLQSENFSETKKMILVK